MLAAGHEPQAEAGLVQQHIGRDQQQQCHQHEPAELEGTNVHQKSFFCAGILDGGGHIIGVGRRVDGLYDNRCPCDAQHIQRRTYNGLVCLEVDAGHGQEAGINHTHQCRRQQNHQQHRKVGRAAGHIPHGQGTAQGAHDHNTLQAQVDNARML